MIAKVIRTHLKLGKPPHNITIYKSSNYIVLSKKFVNFVLTNKKAKDFRRYLQDIQVPEEYFFASIPEAPKGRGGGKGTMPNNIGQ